MANFELSGIDKSDGRWKTIKAGDQIEGNIIDKNFTQAFSNVSTVILSHNLNKYPAITIIDTAGTIMNCEIVHNSINQATISWIGTTSGTIFAN